MSFSPLVDELKTTKKHSPRPGKVTRMIVHHWAGNGAIDWVLNKFVYSTQQSSVSYILRDSGHLIGSVDEKYRPWTSNSAAADNPSITIEIENSPGPGYKVSDAAIEKLTQLLVDVAERHGWSQIRFGHEVRGHREFYATSCPGPYLWPRLPAIAAEADRRLRGGSGLKPGMSKPVPIPVPSKPSGGSREWPGSPLLVDGDFGPVTRRAYQRLLAWDVTGKYTGLIDGQFGPMTVRAEQAWLKKLGHYRGLIDGVRGPLTRKALQSFLYDKGLYRNGRYSKAVLVDGILGARSIKALQNYLNSQRKYA